LNLTQFWQEARAGKHKFAWVSLNDAKVCPDCMAIALQQPHEGATWEEWRAFGFPKSGHTVCQGACRCRMAPMMYMNAQPMLEPTRADYILAETELTPQVRRIVTMVEAWEEAGENVDELNLLGLSAKQQEEYLRRQLRLRGIEVPEEVTAA